MVNIQAGKWTREMKEVLGYPVKPFKWPDGGGVVRGMFHGTDGTNVGRTWD